MNILTVAMFAMLIILSLNPKSDAPTADYKQAGQEVAQQINESGVEGVIQQAATTLRTKHLQ